MYKNVYISKGVLIENTEFCEKVKRISEKVTFAPIDKRPSIQELVEIVKEYEVLIIDTHDKLTSQVYHSANTVKVIGTMSVGKDHIHSEFLTDNRFKIFNVKEANIVSVAEHTLCLILSICKKVVICNDLVSRKIGRKGLSERTIDLQGKTVGIIGLGNIGRKVIELLTPFQVKVIANTKTPEKHKEFIDSHEIKIMDLDTLVSEADIISIHVPLSDETKGILNRNLIEKTKKNCIVINTSRQGLIDEEALYQAATNNYFYGIGLDIDEDVYGFVGIPNCIVTPHVAGSSKEANNRLCIEILDNMIRELNL